METLPTPMKKAIGPLLDLWYALLRQFKSATLPKNLTSRQPQMISGSTPQNQNIFPVIEQRHTNRQTTPTRI